MTYMLYEGNGIQDNTYDPHPSILGDRSLFIRTAGRLYVGMIHSADEYAEKRAAVPAMYPTAVVIGLPNVSGPFANAVLQDIRALNNGNRGALFRDRMMLITDLEEMVAQRTPFEAPSVHRDEREFARQE